MKSLLCKILLVLSIVFPFCARAQVEVPKVPIYGVTLDDLSKLNAIVQSLANLPYRPTVRVVFDTGVSAQSYYGALVTLHQYAYVMGEILDSSYFPTTVSAYTSRTQNLVSVLKNVVDVWEIANEINGEWLRNNPDGPTSKAITQELQIGQMVDAAYNIVKAAGGKVAVTMYYNEDSSGNNCWELPIDSWRTWPTQFMPAEVRTGADYALFSYYPDRNDCPGLSPKWPADFATLESLYPNAKVGFGEIGTSSTRYSTTFQDRLITTYYPMVDSMTDPKFIGGFFWWYYAEEMVPDTSSYWTLLDSTLVGLKAPQ